MLSTLAQVAQTALLVSLLVVDRVGAIRPDIARVWNHQNSTSASGTSSLASTSATSGHSRSSSTTSTPATPSHSVAPHPPHAGACFPSLGFSMPEDVSGLSITNWWCPYNTEYAFVGVSYEVTACQSRDTLRKEFLDVKKSFKGRYIRLYAACDRPGFYDDVVDAAWYAGVGVHALIWFGWDDPNIWKTRRDNLLATLHSNPRAKYVTRVLQFGSEPLYDYALDLGELNNQIKLAQKNLSSLHIPVTISEMAYGYQERVNDGSMDIMTTIDLVDAHMLPFFSTQASTSNNSWPIVTTDLDWFINNGQGKKLYLSQNGWPSTTYPGVSPNSPDAVSDVPNEEAYFKLLDSKCTYFKNAPNGGIAWFAHIYSDNQEPGYGLYDKNGKMKIQFNPRTSC